jgi:hypothetical protein
VLRAKEGGEAALMVLLFQNQRLRSENKEGAAVGGRVKNSLG